jgi:hypothetical protein
MPPLIQNGGPAAMLNQFLATLQGIADTVVPLLNQPIVRMPYNLPLATPITGLVVAAGGRNTPLPSQDFMSSLEWPFEVHDIKFSQDGAHTFRDWRISFKDQVFSQDLQKNSVRVSTIVSDDTGMWRLKFPWIIRPKGGGISMTVDNLDAVNPITVDINLQGYLLVPQQ